MESQDISDDEDLARYHKALPIIPEEDAFVHPAPSGEGDRRGNLASKKSQRGRKARGNGKKDKAKSSQPTSFEKKQVCLRVLFIVACLLMLTAIALAWKILANGADHNWIHAPSFALDTTLMSDLSIPNRYNNLLDHQDRSPDFDNSIPFLWGMPGDGHLLQNVLSSCVKLVAAGRVVAYQRQSYSSDEPLEVFQVGDRSFVNVDTGSPEGIENARRRGLTESGLADIVYAPLVYEAATIFTDARPGRMLGLFHHPVHRVMTVFHISRTIQPMFHNATLEEFLLHPEGANNNNWLTRELAGGVQGPLDENHFQVAKQVLREKCVVGLTSDLDASFSMFFDYFGWEDRGDEYLECERRQREMTGLDQIYFDLVEEDSTGWNMLVELNYYDIRLYDVVKLLYNERKNAFTLS